jgi:hypothetical protein
MEEGDDTADFVPIPNPNEPRRIFLLSEMGWATGDALTPQSSNRWLIPLSYVMYVLEKNHTIQTATKLNKTWLQNRKQSNYSIQQIVLQ